MDKNIYTQADFMNLTKIEVAEIVRLLDITLPNNSETEAYLFGNIGMLEGNNEVNNIITNKVLAGQTTVKWFKYDYNDEFIIDALKEKLRDTEIGYNQNIMERADIYDSINCIINHNNVYTLKILLRDGYFYSSDGIRSTRGIKVKSVVVILDVDNCWVEIRCPEVKISKVIGILYKQLEFVRLEEVKLLKNYSDDINEFKNALFNGFYLNYKAMPSDIVELTDRDRDAVAKIIKSIDEYLQDKDANKLVKTLEDMDYDTEDLSIISILLAGLDNVGMGIKRGCVKDMSDQSFYAVLKDYIIENTSFISFSTSAEGTSYTMQVGLKSNNIRFRSSVTEDVIDYLRNKIL